MKQWLKKWLASSKTMRDHPGLARAHHLMSHPAFWSFNRRSVAPAVAIGMGIMLLPLPFQMLWAALIAIYWKANIPIAVSLTWINNPFTFIPVNLFIYATGHRILRWLSDLETPSPLLELPPSLSLNHIFTWMMALGKPYLVGLAFLIGVCSFLGYTLTSCFWRFSVSRTRQKRQSALSKSP